MTELELVLATKQRLLQQGHDLTGPCGAFAITSRVAWALRDDGGAGLLDKPTGNNCQGFAVDIICYPNGDIYDILGDAGGENRPTWNFAGTVDPPRYRPPFSLDPVPNPPPVPSPPSTGVILEAIAEALTRAGQGLLDAAAVLRGRP